MLLEIKQASKLIPGLLKQNNPVSIECEASFNTRKYFLNAAFILFRNVMTIIWLLVDIFDTV